VDGIWWFTPIIGLVVSLIISVIRGGGDVEENDIQDDELMDEEHDHSEEEPIHSLPDPPPPSTVIEESGALDNPGGCIATTIIGVVAVAFLVWGSVSAWPYIETWLDDNVFNKEEVVEVVEGSVKQDCPVVEQVEVGPDPNLMCPGCPVCPEAWRLDPNVDPAVLNEYLDEADRIIITMYEARSVLFSMKDVMQSFGTTNLSFTQAFEDRQWLVLWQDFELKVEIVRDGLRKLWPPGPYTGSPLLDSQARLWFAYSYLAEAQLSVRKAISTNQPYRATQEALAQVDLMVHQIDNAEWGLGEAR
jgi:hypothetical protein